MTIQSIQNTPSYTDPKIYLITFNLQPGADYVLPEHFVIIVKDPNDEKGSENFKSR